MLNLIIADLEIVVNSAKRAAAGSPRWINAIDRAAQELIENPYIDRDEEHGGLLIGSPSGNCYAANGVCQCKAFEFGRPCWHRSAARLIQRYDERLDRRAAYDKAVAELDECYA